VATGNEHRGHVAPMPLTPLLRLLVALVMRWLDQNPASVGLFGGRKWLTARRIGLLASTLFT